MFYLYNLSTLTIVYAKSIKIPTMAKSDNRNGIET